MVDDITKDMSKIDLTTIIYEVNLVESNPKKWWIDMGAIGRLCSDKKMFSIFKPVKTREKVFMGNSPMYYIYLKFVRTWCLVHC